MRANFVVVAAVAFLLLAPAATAQLDNPDEPTPTTLYFHVFDTFNKFVINTQPMDAEFFDVGGTNNPTVMALGYDLNTIYGTSTAGPVEYDFIENGKPRFHPERGIAQDVRIDSGTQPIVYLYLDVRDIFGVDGLPNTLPTMTFRVTMREGDDPGRDAQLDAGDPIMHGEVQAHLVDTWTAPTAIPNAAYQYVFCLLDCSDLPDKPLPEEGASINDVVGTIGTTPDGTPVLAPDESGIIEVPIPMTLDAEVIPKSQAFNVRIDWYQTMGGAFGEDEFSEGYFRLVADQDHLPRLEMSILNPVYVEFLHPQVAAGTLLIHTGVNSPWGTYDIDVENITVRVDGPDQPQTLERVIAQNAHVHGLHDQAAEVTYLWAFRDEGAAEGEYSITMEVPNLAGNAVATATGGFTIEGKRAFGVSDTGDVVPGSGEDETEGSPTPGFGLLAVALAIGLAARRRWA